MARRGFRLLPCSLSVSTSGESRSRVLFSSRYMWYANIRIRIAGPALQGEKGVIIGKVAKLNSVLPANVKVTSLHFFVPLRNSLGVRHPIPQEVSGFDACRALRPSRPRFFVSTLFIFAVIAWSGSGASLDPQSGPRKRSPSRIHPLSMRFLCISPSRRISSRKRVWRRSAASCLRETGAQFGPGGEGGPCRGGRHPICVRCHERKADHHDRDNPGLQQE